MSAPPEAAVVVRQFKFDVQRNAAHKGRIKIFDEIGRKENKVLVLIEEHEQNRARLVDAYIGGAGHVRHTPAENGVGFVKEEDAPRFLGRSKSLANVFRRFAHVFRLDVGVVHDQNRPPEVAGNGMGRHGLARPRRAVEVDAQAL